MLEGKELDINAKYFGGSNLSQSQVNYRPRDESNAVVTSLIYAEKKERGQT